MKTYPQCSKPFIHYCGICKRALNDPNDRTTEDCGGDCLRCMAECGDEDCQRAMDEIMTSPAPLDDKPIERPYWK